jgi:hypothetical protein
MRSGDKMLEIKGGSMILLKHWKEEEDGEWNDALASELAVVLLCSGQGVDEVWSLIETTCNEGIKVVEGLDFEESLDELQLASSIDDIMANAILYSSD